MIKNTRVRESNGVINPICDKEQEHRGNVAIPYLHLNQICYRSFVETCGILWKLRYWASLHSQK